MRLFERLLDLPVVLHQPDVIRHTVCTLGHRGQRVQDAAVDFARIGLSTDAEALAEPEGLRKIAIHRIDLFRIAFKQFHEARFGTGRTAASEEFDIS